MASPSSYSWTNDFDAYIASMTRGHGYGGEAYWDEEEAFLKRAFSSQYISRSLSMGCGLFRELDAMKAITADEIWGMDADRRFIDHIQPLQSSSTPVIRVEHADLYHVVIHPKERFDLVMMLFNTLGNLPDIALALQKLYAMVRPGGSLVLTFWRDDDAITRLRQQIYTGARNTRAAVECNAATALSDIVVYRDEKPVFRSAILSKSLLQSLASELLPQGEVEFTALHYAHAMVVRKPACLYTCNLTGSES